MEIKKVAVRAQTKAANKYSVGTARRVSDNAKR